MNGAAKIEPAVEVFYLDTDFLFPETYATRDRVVEKYGVKLVAYKSVLTPEEQAQQHGRALANSVEAAMQIIAGSARSMGIEVKG